MASQVKTGSSYTARTLARIRNIASKVGDFLVDLDYPVLALAIAALVAWGTFAWVGWSDLPAPMDVNAQIPQNAEVVAQLFVSSPGFGIRMELTDLLSRASDSGETVLVTYGVVGNTCRIEYWLPRGDGLMYYHASVTTDPPSDWSGRGLNADKVCFDDGTFALYPGKSAGVMGLLLMVAVGLTVGAVFLWLDGSEWW